MIWWSGTGSNRRPSAFRRNPVIARHGWKSLHEPLACKNRGPMSPGVGPHVRLLAPAILPARRAGTAPPMTRQEAAEINVVTSDGSKQDDNAVSEGKCGKPAD